MDTFEGMFEKLACLVQERNRVDAHLRLLVSWRHPYRWVRLRQKRRALQRDIARLDRAISDDYSMVRKQ